MNPISITETAREIAKKFPELISKESASSAPLLCIKKGTIDKEVKSWLIDSMIPEMMPPPHDAFKLSIPYSESTLNGIGVYEKTTNCLRVILKHPKGRLIGFGLNEEGGVYLSWLAFFINGEWIPVDRGVNQLPNDHAIAVKGWIIQCLAQFRNPLLITVKASPERKPFRSVEWVKAREYYTVIHRRHSANTKDAVERGTYGDGTHKRIAHARKAHFRILRSEKWGKNQGRRVFVSSAWIGPREWVDAESKQIYTIQRT